jgi:hypothetical protein
MDKDEIIYELQEEIQNLSQKIRELSEWKINIEEKLTNHNHTGEDGSKRLEDTIQTRPGTVIGTNLIHLTSASRRPTFATSQGFITVGEDSEDGSLSKKYGNAQLTIEHQHPLSSNSFFYAYRPPLYTGLKGNTTSASTTFTTRDFDFVPNELSNSFLLVNYKDGTFDCFKITSNNKNIITITGGTFAKTETNTAWGVFKPLYLGAAQFPWYRIAVMDGTDGGVRFGRGATNAGQNGLLYMDSVGDLYWRNKSGSSLKLNQSSSGLGAPSELTISSGSITPTGGFHTVDTEGNASSDDLDNINDINLTDGTILVIKAENSTRTVVAKDFTGNLRLNGDFSLTHVDDTLTLILQQSIWYEISRSDNNT